MLQIDHIGIRGGLELTPLPIELALGVTHTIACGVDALTPMQFALVACHLCNNDPNSAKQQIRICGHWGHTSYDWFRRGPL